MSIAEKLVTIAENVQKVYEAGQKSGGGGGYDEGYEAGKQAEQNAFWDTYLMNGDRRNFTQAFYSPSGSEFVWYDTNYNPNRELVVQTAQSMYQRSPITSTKVPITLLDNCSINNMFASCLYLVDIPLLKLGKNINTAANPFYNCQELTNIVIEGEFEYNISFQYSKKLSKTSIISIINALSLSTTGLAITLSLDAVNKAFETSEGANDGSNSTQWYYLSKTKNNWTISLV